MRTTAPYELTAPSAIGFMLRGLELPRGPPPIAEKLRLLLKAAVCRWTSCTASDGRLEQSYYLMHFVIEQRGHHVTVHGVKPSWPCSDAINRSVISRLPELFAQEHVAVRRLAESLAANARNASFLLDLTDRCTLDLFVDSCRYPLLCHVRRAGGCALPIPYREPHPPPRQGSAGRRSARREAHRLRALRGLLV
jgi:hypothetical protein